MKTLKFPTSHKTQLMDISAEVKEAVITSGVKEGVCVVFTPHTTGSVFLFENADQNLRRDLLAALSTVIPSDAKYAHVGDNAAAHLKSSRMGASVSIPVHEGRPMFGKWQGVFFGEFDGPRQEREVIIKVIAG
ncbi:MAG: YjbQ family protein [Sulfuricurvum sp.]|jgi:secondary thiamine-phosphate synthase enzyme|uniref:secondary thiamine-phosphate synthase enzyme YjbQ n=1 Tax=Sulfuricurvum sp. TaxID=2025608 RepID=UPI0025E584DD|nr:secondary thiamine-phosphate synthase enzyme YjbQ [Sulfuricurvum sp.]MBV5320254.1 YjbQ family protein [Sulfuricurvum sp.]